MKRFAVFLMILCLLFPFCACASSPVTAETWAYDTYCTATVWGGTGFQDVFSSAVREGECLLSERGEKQFFASKDGEILPLSSELFCILQQAEILYEATQGLYDPTIAPLSQLWDVTHAVQPPSSEEISSVLPLVGWDGVLLNETELTFSKKGMGIDIGSLGKGYGADLTARALKESGATGGVVSFGGNVALFGTKNGEPFRVGVRDPKHTAQTLGILTLTEVSVVTSGAYERWFEFENTVYHHLLDPKTGNPRNSDLLSVTVVCKEGAWADMVSTALWLVGYEEALQLYEALNQMQPLPSCQVVFVRDDGTVWVSEDLRDNFVLMAEGYVLTEEE